MVELKVKETLVLPSGVTFNKGEKFYGHFEYYSSLHTNVNGSKLLLPLVVVISRFDPPMNNSWLLPKENFEL